MKILPYFATAYALFRLIRSLQHQKYWLKTHLQPLLQPYNPDTVLTVRHLKKVHQYAWLTVVGVSEAIAELRGKSLTQPEREKQTYLAAVSALFDTMFDEKLIAPTRIMVLTEEYRHITPQNNLERLFVFLITQLNDNQPFQPIALEAIRTIAQVQQAENTPTESLSFQSLWEKTKQKCGSAVLLCTYYMENSFDEKTLQALYQVGGVYQVMDDILDYYDDFHAHQATIVTLAGSLEDIEIIYRDEIEKVRSQIDSLALPAAPKRNFWNKISLMYGTAFVALAQYRKYEKYHQFPLAQYLPRKALICDMEQPTNLLRLVAKTAPILGHG